MTLRTKSRGRQWMVWGGLVLTAVVIAEVWSVIATGSANMAYFHPLSNRLSLPFFALFAYLAWEMRWDGIRRDAGREKREEIVEQPVKLEVEEKKPNGKGITDNQRLVVPQEDKFVRKEEFHSSTTASTSKITPTEVHKLVVEGATGEELFDQARSIQHHRIPDLEQDGQYLALLGRSAMAGYVPALVKLGEYAMRRAAWVEAYYWMKLAERRGMENSEVILRKIRKHWSAEGFPQQASNVNELFTVEFGSLGRALLHIDSGHEAAKAKEFLRANHPEFL